MVWFFLSATPVEERADEHRVASLAGPAVKGSANLRAIPWVFGWTVA